MGVRAGWWGCECGSSAHAARDTLTARRARARSPRLRAAPPVELRAASGRAQIRNCRSHTRSARAAKYVTESLSCFHFSVRRGWGTCTSHTHTLTHANARAHSVALERVRTRLRTVGARARTSVRLRQRLETRDVDARHFARASTTTVHNRGTQSQPEVPGATQILQRRDPGPLQRGATRRLSPWPSCRRRRRRRSPCAWRRRRRLLASSWPRASCPCLLRPSSCRHRGAP